jgi:hypothetical protein
LFGGKVELLWDCFDTVKIWCNCIQCRFRLNDSTEPSSEKPMCNLHKNFISLYGVKLRRLILSFLVWSQRFPFNASYHRQNSPKKLKWLNNSCLSANYNHWKAKRHIVLGLIHYKREPYWKHSNRGQSQLTEHSWNPKCLRTKSTTSIKWQSAIIGRLVSCSRWVPINYDGQTS